MSTSEKSYAGGCFCGAVGYEISGTPRFLCYCHCESCRQAAGSPAVAWGTFERSGFRVTRGRMREFNSSPKVTRGFCADCGSCLTYSHEGRPGDIDVTLATLEEAANLAPTLQPLLSVVSGEEARIVQELAADSRPSVACGWGRDNRIEAISNSRLLGYDWLALGTLFSKGTSNGTMVH